ncbi:hypothetical protein ABB37_09912 [Leptomonas pyrrhocoris]|uniref:Uncharacterized protein n=1 Tax=Leptomonas pyrrhocoris TaxID=157538 RepID=A0A0M9FPQ1_LEPPY|nr:hypothetical protein ABB37_09912 [Leptomonas pyrrhocoris]KPA73356.1 hypothetical protein ABB37_09912 [Leptomonas pyrrhocoris]|eukprot:XP_015651795.1 hypothetical protein ABB37_09912 [Leptomonas pyrrhocoris]
MAAAMNSLQLLGNSWFYAPSGSAAAAAAANAGGSGSNPLELLRTHHLYVRTLKTRWRNAVVFLFAFLFFCCCTFRGPQAPGQSGQHTLFGSSGSGDGAGGGSGGSSNGAGAMGLGAGVAGGLTGAGAMENVGAGDDFTAAAAADAHRRYFQPPWLLRVLLGYTAVPGRLEMEDVEWWPPSNRTPEISDPNSEQGLRVGTPNAASLSVARSEPPWSADTRTGVLAILSRLIGSVSHLVFTPERPSYELALSAFSRTRQAMTEGSCNRCQARVIEQEVRLERQRYWQFLRESKLRLPMLLYYNRLPVYAMIQHFRLMRVRNYQLLDYVSRADAALRRPETVGNDVSNDAALHARELDFELTRLPFVFYLQRLHLRALRHADAMRLETFHFLRHLSSTVPTLRHIWTGQDHCSWPGVSCVVVRVPLNLLVDDDHPAVRAFVNDLFSVCRGPGCRQRRCVPPACAAYTQYLTRRLFTSAAPGYWMKWDRTDDTAAMDEMIFPKPTARKNVGVEPPATVAAPHQPLNGARGAPWHGASTGNADAMKPEEKTAGHGDAGSYPAGHAGRTITSSSRTVWTEQQFAYEHPSLLLAEPMLLVDVDVKAIMEEVVRPATPLAEAAKVVAGEHVDPAETYRENVERPLVEDLLPMQEKLLRTIAAAAPRGLRFGKQSRRSPGLTIPFTFVALNLPSMGLRGYLPDFYDTPSAYDVAEVPTAGGEGDEAGGRGAGTPQTHGSTNGAGGGGAAAASAAPGRAGRPQDVQVSVPRSDVYWGRPSRQRMLESRNPTLRRPLATVQAIAGEVQRVLRRVERIGMRHHHHDLAVYFSEVATLARFHDERWSAYRWPEAMITVTKAVAPSASRQLYPIVEDNAFSAAFATPVYNVDRQVGVFGELNPRLIALLAFDVSGNPLLSGIFPRTWLSIPFLQSVRTHGASVLAPPLRMRTRTYNHSLYCSRGSSGNSSGEAANLHAADARQSPRYDPSDTAIGIASPLTSVHDRDYIGSVLIPPFRKVDSLFPPGRGVDAFLVQKDPLSAQQHLYKDLHEALDDGFWKGVRRLLTHW